GIAIYTSIVLTKPQQQLSTLFPYTTLFRSGNSPLHLNGDNYVAGAGEAVEITQDSQWFQNGCIVIRPENTEAGISVENLERAQGDRKSTRLNSSHVSISYAVFCVKKKKVNE